MAERHVNIGLYRGGEFRRTSYSGGDCLTIYNVDADMWAYNDLMEEVKNLLKLNEIGGVYAKEGKHGGWKLLRTDLDIIQEIEKCNDGEEVKLYVDTVVDPAIEPLCEIQPHVIVRPRKSLFEVSPKKIQKRKYITTHELQQKQNPRKIVKKTPEPSRRYALRSSPALLPTQQDATAGQENDKGSARRKLQLQDDIIPDKELPPPPLTEIKRKNPRTLQKNEKMKDQLQGDARQVRCPLELARPDIETESPPPPLLACEQERLNQMKENDRRLEELGIKKLVGDLRAQSATVIEKSKEKDKASPDDDDYNPESEDEHDSDDSSERTKNGKKKNHVPLGPRTRSRANVTAATENEPSQAGKTSDKEMTSKSKLLKPTCSKILKSASNSESCASVFAYLALRERQKQGILPPTPENVHASNSENVVNKETEAVPKPKKWRGRTKLLTGHARTRDERPVIFLNKQNVPVSRDGKLTRELSNFLGTVAKDNVSLTYVNWSLVPEQLKKKMWDYTRDHYIIPNEAQSRVYKTIDRCLRTYKSRMKAKHYTQHATDDERLEHRLKEIPLEDFKLLIKYWGDESVKELPHDKKVIRASKETDPNLASPSKAEIYLQSHEQDGRIYKTTAAPKKRNRKNKKAMESDSAPADTFLEDLTAKIRGELEVELEEKVSKKVQDNLSVILKKIAAANPGLNLDIGEVDATISSKDDENGTPMTIGTAGTSNDRWGPHADVAVHVAVGPTYGTHMLMWQSTWQWGPHVDVAVHMAVLVWDPHADVAVHVAVHVWAPHADVAVHWMYDVEVYVAVQSGGSHVIFSEAKVTLIYCYL